MQILWDRNINDINPFCKILKINVKVCVSDSAEEPDKMQIDPVLCIFGGY